MLQVLLITTTLLFTLVTNSSALSYSVTGLGTLDGGWASYAKGINDKGQIVGASYNSNDELHAFFYDSSVGMKDLGTLGGTRSSASSINNNGQIVGYSWGSGPASEHAFIYDVTQQTGMQDLGNLGRPHSMAIAINEDGKAVGYSNTTSSTRRQATTFDITGAQHLLPYGKGVTSSSAYSINDSEQIVGSFTSTSTGGFHAFLYDPEDGMLDLAEHRLASLVPTSAGDINSSGVVVGTAKVVGTTNKHAYLYNQTTGMIDLGALGINSSAKAINNRGEIIGDSILADSFEECAFIYTLDSGMQNLNDFIDDERWKILHVRDINQMGQIVGYGTYDGHTQAFLLTPTASPVPEPSTAILFGCAFGAFFWVRSKKKLFKSR